MARVRTAVPLWMGGVGSLALFLLGVQLLGTTTELAAAPLDRVFDRYAARETQALGISWIATYVLTNGSVIAALAVSLFEADVVTGPQLFLMVAGSRLGAAAIVVLIGVLDFLQKRRYSLGQATSLGLLTFLLTHSIYVPATVIGFLLLPLLEGLLSGIGTRLELAVDPLALLGPAMAGLVGLVGVAAGFAIALVLLVASLNLFDRVLARVDTSWLRRHVFHRFRNRWVAIGLGLLITGLTTSVAFSLGVIVPLYNRGYLERREVVPYILGANIGTFFDTLVVAVVLDSPDGFVLVLALLAVGSVITLSAMVWFTPYLATVEAVQTRLVEDRRALAAFLVSLVLVPLAFTFLPL